MKISIVKFDSTVAVDGVSRSVDLSALDAKISSVHYDTSSHTGTVKFVVNLVPALPDQNLGKVNFSNLFNRYLQAWKAFDAPVRTPQQIADDNAAQMENSNANLAREFTKIDPVIRYLVTHTPAECAAYVQLNVTNLATAKDMLAKFAMALSVLARQQFK